MDNKKKYGFDIFKGVGKEKIVIMAIAGIALIILSYLDFDEKEEIKDNTNKSVVNASNDTYVSDLEKRLEKLIEKVDGVGECNVMITLKSSEERILKSDKSSHTKNETGSDGVVKNESDVSENALVLKGDEEKPYVIKEIMPEIEGVVVLAEGAKKENIYEAIISIVQALFDVEMHKISIIEMN